MTNTGSNGPAEKDSGATPQWRIIHDPGLGWIVIDPEGRRRAKCYDEDAAELILSSLKSGQPSEAFGATPPQTAAIADAPIKRPYPVMTVVLFSDWVVTFGCDGPYSLQDHLAALALIRDHISARLREKAAVEVAQRAAAEGGVAPDSNPGDLS